MPNASRSIYLFFHAVCTVLARAVKRTPIHTMPSYIEKRAAKDDLSSGARAGYIVFIIVLVTLSGITAGLTLGLMSLDETQCK